jgi:RNA exonuclease 4
MPGLELSSNWKILQARLNAGKKAEATSNGVKRKRPTDQSSKHTNAYKKARVSATGDNATALGKKSKMGGYLSSEQTPAAPQKGRSALVKEHDIPASDVSAAYGAPTALGSATKFKDDINGGLHPTHKAGKYLSLDCEMVGIGPPPHEDHMLARVSLVNFHGEQIYDSYVLPQFKVEDYRTHVSGISPSHLKPGCARHFSEVQRDVATLLRDRILVGHALKGDLQVLLLTHAQRDVRDTSRYPKFRIESKGKPPALRKLTKSELGLIIQTGEHSSIEDARATMMLFRKEKAGFEEENRKVFGQKSSFHNRKQGKTERGAATNNESAEDDEDDDEEDELDTLDGEEDEEDQPKPTTQVKKKRKKKKNTKRK